MLREHNWLQFVDEPDFFEDFLDTLPGSFQGTLLIDVLSGEGLAVVGLIQDRASGALVALPAGTSNFTTVSGGQILDSLGRPLQLRGINLGGWLVPEGYILHIPGYGSPTAIRDRIADLIGSEQTDQFFESYRANYLMEKDIEQIAGWGFNSVRVPFHYRLLYDESRESFDEAGFARLANLVNWCRKYRLYVILDMHCAPGGQNKDNISDSNGSVAALWTEPEHQDLTVAIWAEIARRFARDQSILGYDLLNEPVMPTGYSNAVLRNLYVRITTEIRKLDPHHLIFIEGNWYATDFSLLTPPFDSKLVYSFHKYWNQTGISTIQSYLSIRQTHNVPLWLGEFGENSNPWGHEVIRLMEDNGIGWCWWTHKKLDTITSPLSASISPAYQAVLDYWNGQGGRPSADAARSALFGMAEDLAIDKCTRLPDVIRTLLDPSFGTIAEPRHDAFTVPGRINAVDFDTGTDGVGYHDAYSRRTEYSNTRAWNEGWQYRNDGVDIEKSSDPEGPGYNVGWIEDGEWLRYSVEVAQAGSYNLEVRVASSGGGGILRVLLDDQPVGPDVNVPATGGWQSWSTLEAGAIELPAGRHVLKLHVVRGGFNLSSVRIADL